MHPPVPPSPTGSIDAERSLASGLVSVLLTIVAIATAATSASLTGTALASVPVLAVPAAFLVGVSTLITIPLAVTVLSRTLVARLERDQTYDAVTTDTSADDRLPTPPTHSRR